MTTETETIDRLKRALEHAPRGEGANTSEVKGWIVDGVEVCQHCAGRIMARGCKLGNNCIPVWDRTVGCEIH